MDIHVRIFPGMGPLRNEFAPVQVCKQRDGIFERQFIVHPGTMDPCLDLFRALTAVVETKVIQYAGADTQLQV